MAASCSMPPASVGAIVEQKDANDDVRALRLVNTGIIAADATALRGWLGKLRNDNAQGEYYLTDVFAMAAEEFSPAEIVRVADPVETEGANDPWQLAQLERAFQLRAAQALAVQGVRFADPARFDQRGQVSVGRDVEIDVDVILEGRVVLGDGVRIGPFCRIKDATLAAGTVVQRALRHRRRADAGRLRDRAVRPPAPRHRPRRWRARRQLRRNQEDHAWRWLARPITSATWATRRSAPASTSAPARSPATTTASTSR